MRILHLADTHIGTRQYGLEERRRDFSRAFHQAIEIAVREGVDAVVHAGDLFDDRYPSAEDLHETLQALFHLKEAGIPFLGVVGNHEQRRGVQWLDLFAHLGLAVHLSEEPFKLQGVPFYGLDYAGRRGVPLPEMEPDSVLVCHQMLDQVRSDGELRLEDLWRSGARFVLLGDYHEHEVWREGRQIVTYPGSTERWQLNERRPRGVSLIDLETGQLDRRELRTRHFEYIYPEEDPLETLRAKRNRLEGAVVCVYLRGRSHRVQEIEEQAREYGALAVRVRDVQDSEQEEDGEEDSESPPVQLEFGNLDALLSERLAQLELSPEAQAIDQVIRDPKIADSRVDGEVTRLLSS